MVVWEAGDREAPAYPIVDLGEGEYDSELHIVHWSITNN